jgi:hypothetical protein
MIQSFSRKLTISFVRKCYPSWLKMQLELPLDSADPLIPYQFHFEDSGWGPQWRSNFDYEETQWNGIQSESWEKEMAPALLWYDNTPSWDQTHQNQSWDWQTQATST